MKTHEIKCWSQFFEALIDGSKRFEMRFNDRDYKTGDILIIREWRANNKFEKYTGRSIKMKVGFVLPGGHWGLEPGYICMSVELLEVIDG